MKYCLKTDGYENTKCGMSNDIKSNNLIGSSITDNIVCLL